MCENLPSTVLTIEDDTALRRSIVTCLEDIGCKVIEASCGQEGLDLFRLHHPDIVFTDLIMPGIHGLDLIPLLRKEDPEIPIVVISGTGAIDDAVEAMKRGAWDFVSKPIRDIAILDSLTTSLVEKARAIKSAALSSGAAQYMNAIDHFASLPGKNVIQRVFNEKISARQNPSLIIVNLDRFKEIDSSLGQSAGMELLGQVAERIKLIMTEHDICAHLDADEFAVLSVKDDTHVIEISRELTDSFKKPFIVNEQEIYVTACQGIVLSHQGSTSFEEVLRRANMALCMARTMGRNSTQQYEADFGKIVRERNELDSLLRKALEQEEFVLYFQPQYLVRTGELVGAETLVRWKKPNGDLVSPSDFIPVLEESGLIIPVGEYILRQACAQFMKWQSMGLPPFAISVNISIAQFKSGALSATLMEIASETGMDLSFLCLELTESIVMEDIEQTIQTLEELRGLGVQLSIDDFGTGYSSLSYLGRMPITELKIDRSFILSLPGDRSNAILVTTIINMARGMNIRVVAEGIENEEQLLYLKELNCDVAQGFYLNKPMDADRLAQLVSLI